MNTELDIVIAGLVGLVIGVVLMAIVGRGNKGKKDEETAKLQAEYDRYREQVNAHFAKTADAVDGLTKSYQQVFEHLSDGAQNLMDKKVLQEQLEKRQGKAVTLAYLVDQQDDLSQAKVGDVKVSSVVNDSKDNKEIKDKKETLDPPVKKEAPVPVDEKADVIAYANEVKTAPKTAALASSSAANTQTSKAATTETAGKANLDKTATTPARADDRPDIKADTKPEGQKDAPKTAQQNGEGKSNVHKAAENAGLKPAETIVKSNHHESAIDSVKKHIKDGDKEPKV